MLPQIPQIMITEMQALQNAANDLGLKIWQEMPQKRTAKFTALLDGCTVSPVLGYDQMNHFLLGWRKAAKHLHHATN